MTGPRMVANSFTYRFRVRLPASADRAYRWALDYRPDDPSIMGEDGDREIERLAPDTVVLTDTIRDGRRSVSKRRLVRILPDGRSWTNTHLAGPIVHSQYLYRIVPRGRNSSVLEFSGMQIEYTKRALSASARARRTREIRRGDRAIWTHLVRAMKSDLANAR